MIEKLSTVLADGTKFADISPEMLELLGKQAANIYMEKGISLNEAIPKLASVYPDINQEQIKRVCEFANNSVYLAKHDQSKTAGAAVSYPEFDLADPNRVIQDMSDGAKPVVMTKVDADYGKLPEKKQKTSSVEEEALAQMFKAASAEMPDFSRDTAIEEVMSAKGSLQALRNQLSHVGEEMDLMNKEARAEFYELAKRHVLDGGSVVDLFKAAEVVAGNQKEVEEVLGSVIKNFIKEKVASAEEMTQAVRGLTKVAHRVINPEHPLVKTAGTIVQTIREIEKICSSFEEVEEQLGKVNAFIKETFSA